MEYIPIYLILNKINYSLIFLIILINFLIGYDLDGLLSGQNASSEIFLDKIGLNKFGSFYSFNFNIHKDLEYISTRCIGCKNCIEVCPVNVFSFNDEDYLVSLKNKSACIKCSSCINNCPEDALYFQ